MNTPTANRPLPDWKESFTTAKAMLGVVAFLLLLAALFYDRIQAIVEIWAKDANYSHGFLIVPISLWLVYQRLGSVKTPLVPEIGIGAITMVVGMLVFLANYIFRVMVVDFLALAMILRGATVAMGGREWASSFSFPIFFLFFMFPLPVLWTNFTSVWLQDRVSWISGQVLSMFFVCHQQGNMIMVAGAAEPLFVAQECSGLRQLVAFLALATLVAYLSKRGLVFGVILVVAAVPVAILSNVLRVLLMAFVIRYLGAQAVSGWLHDIPALVTLPIGLLFFFLIYVCIGDFFGSAQAEAEGTR